MCRAPKSSCQGEGAWRAGGGTHTDSNVCFVCRIRPCISSSRSPPSGFVVGLYWFFFEALAPLLGSFALPKLLGSFLAGGGCSVLAWALVYPLDTAKSRVQAPPTPPYPPYPLP